jgi:hypothetical protein
MEKEYIGIDYSLGKANYDLKTGIHYGIISQNEVLQAWADSSEPYYGKINYCSDCGFENKIENEFCEVCGADLDTDFLDPVSFYVDDEEYQAESDDSGDIFISKSPYYTNCQYCSPCAPGAGYIMNTVEDGVKTYCFGHDWFEGKKAPYPVYSIETDQLIEP